jgi:hypothetical protein
MTVPFGLVGEALVALRHPEGLGYRLNHVTVGTVLTSSVAGRIRREREERSAKKRLPGLHEAPSVGGGLVVSSLGGVPGLRQLPGDLMQLGLSVLATRFR